MHFLTLPSLLYVYCYYLVVVVTLTTLLVLILVLILFEIFLSYNKIKFSEEMKGAWSN